MERLKKSIVLFFTNIDYSALRKSFLEVLWLTLIALFPLIINIIIGASANNDLSYALNEKILPGEILSYCLSFIAPSLYLLTKTQGSGYRLPLLHGFSIVTLLIYVSTVVIYLALKNKWEPGINMDPHEFDFFFKLTLTFLSVTILFRIYSVYHGKNMTNWAQRREQEQKAFNEDFTNMLNQQK